MKLTFEPDLPFQKEAIESIIDLFEGQPMEDAIFEFNLNKAGQLNLINGVSNKLVLSEEQILENLNAIQVRNSLSPTADGFGEAGLNFSVEMETGTGKTYVYLRTIHIAQILRF